MIVVRFKVRCRPGTVGQAIEVMSKVVQPSRSLHGVVSFDIARDVTDPDCILALEVFEDLEAVGRQELLPEVADVMSLLPSILADPPEATRYHVSLAEPHAA